MTMRMYCQLCTVYCTHPLLQFLRRLKTTFIPQCGARPLCSIILCYLTPWCQYLHPSSQLSPQTSVLHGAVTRSPDIYSATQISTYLDIYTSTDIYILDVYIYITRSPISCWGLWRRPLQVCSLDLVIYCHVFTNPSRAELGTGRGQILADC